MDVFAIMGFFFGLTAFVMIVEMEKRLKVLANELSEIRKRLPDSF